MSSRALAYHREIEAAQLEEEEIWFSVVDSFVRLNVPDAVKAEMLFSAVGNRFDIIDVALTYGIEKNIFSEFDLKSLYNELIRVILNYRK